MDIRFITLDLDGTLKKSCGYISDETLVTFKMARASIGEEIANFDN